MSDAQLANPKEMLLAYESLKIQEKSIKKQIEDMKDAIIALVPEDKELALEHGTITKSLGRVSWTYSPQLKQRIDEVEDAKTLEQQNGDATAKYGDPFVTYKEKKD